MVYQLHYRVSKMNHIEAEMHARLSETLYTVQGINKLMSEPPENVYYPHKRVTSERAY